MATFIGLIMNSKCQQTLVFVMFTLIIGQMLPQQSKVVEKNSQDVTPCKQYFYTSFLYELRS